jgi:hypothetical protein
MYTVGSAKVGYIRETFHTNRIEYCILCGILSICAHTWLHFTESRNNTGRSRHSGTGGIFPGAGMSRSEENI